MARSRANDYDDKRQAILNRSAELFSAHGYDRASMNKIAEACGVSKANLYHYYKDKEGLLFDVIRFHLEELLEVVEAADNPAAAPETRLRGLIAALLEAYRDADSQHNVQISSMRFLPAERQAELKGMERDLVRIFSAAVAGAAPHLKGTKMLTPVTMSLFGMVNWHYLWFKSTGSVSRDEYAEIVTRLIADGARSLLKSPPKTSKRTAAAE
ncbi:MAG TPA: TetR/AcrR family transcriptional regulator [Afipia sp.]|uniref:TetR/AcrR family transcriptional regulator n=1 Tax=unclassified Afipia TaxID=2642050 RepID=UPI00046450CA|nr:MULTISPECIES: TetR/AcrR family transcriptional regulator [unclassified Afipia]MAH71550.1 TetR/AcrR family transcriptional regulator [Afipia sp.]OUX59391.1 MAG: TetR family transcriptional regulator [Afipia sp. TMED4]HAO42736.1 TetR/AcrR family transcriptional regulator [Afipia sp.]HAP11557.1 TetR/AcrR family transcriptional regulator [Afipia sp.]HAP48566.1 TetR/AcrR family transcriptional regulator [Afipia sp.]